MSKKTSAFWKAFKELYVNTSSGKVSGSGFIGLVLGLVGAFSFLLSMVGYFLRIEQTVQVQESIIILITISAALLGVRKWAGTNINKYNSKQNTHKNDNTLLKS